ncbi:hypothetical protein D3C72_1408460 [compost metagenome]
MITQPSEIDSLRARSTLWPALIRRPDSQPPLRLPSMAPTNGTQANRPICLMSKPKVSAR